MLTSRHSRQAPFFETLFHKLAALLPLCGYSSLVLHHLAHGQYGNICLGAAVWVFCGWVKKLPKSPQTASTNALDLRMHDVERSRVALSSFHVASLPSERNETVVQ
jgi:hypothetical protein